MEILTNIFFGAYLIFFWFLQWIITNISYHDESTSQEDKNLLELMATTIMRAQKRKTPSCH